MALLWAGIRQLVGRSVPPLPLGSLFGIPYQQTRHIAGQAANLRCVLSGAPVQPPIRWLTSGFSGTVSTTGSTSLGSRGIAGESAAGHTSPGGRSAGTNAELNSPPGAGSNVSAGPGAPPVRGAEASTGLRSPADAGSGETSPGLCGATSTADGTTGGGDSAASETPEAEEQPGEPEADFSGGGEAAAAAKGSGGEPGTHDAEAPPPGTGEGASGDENSLGAEGVTVSERSDSLLTILTLPVRMFTEIINALVRTLGYLLKSYESSEFGYPSPNGYASVQYWTNFVETDFSMSEFLDSAKDAYFILQQLFMECDLATMRPMVSPAIMAAFEETVRIMVEERTTFKVLKHEVDDAFISNVQYLSPAEYSTATRVAATAEEKEAAQAEVAQSRRKEGMDSQYAAGKYMVVSVHFSGCSKTERITLSDVGSSKHILTDRQTNVWKFARGPLPARLPANYFDEDWIVIGIA